MPTPHDTTHDTTDIDHRSDGLLHERLPALPASDIGLAWTVDEDRVHVVVAGMVCTWSVRALTHRISELAWQYPERHLMLDLSGVSFADARMVTMLVELGVACNIAGSDLRLTECSRAAERILRLCDVIEGFDGRSSQ